MIYYAYELLPKLKYLTLTGLNIDGKCQYICTSNCRREGCNCECGEYHLIDKELEFIGSAENWSKVKEEIKLTFKKI